MSPGGVLSRFYRPMTGRLPDEATRTSTPLELLFDLCFVVAVSQSADGLHHALAEHRLHDGLLGYVTTFFAIWWAWVNFTWFASAYDVDDAPYRLATLVQISGVLVLAAGIPTAFRGDFAIVTLGYLIMRLALVTQWLRAAAGHPERATTNRRYAAGTGLAMLGWGGLLLLPGGARTPAFFVMVAVEVLLPRWAESTGRTPWHPHHIAERYALFTIIVLGESVLSATVAIQTVVDSAQPLHDVASLVAGAPLVVFAMWWLYFARPAGSTRPPVPQPFVWGYGHFLVFASAAAVGAGVVLGVDRVAGEADVSGGFAAAAVTVPVAVYVLAVWALHLRQHHADRAHAVLFPGAAALVLLSTAGPAPVLVTGLLLGALAGADLLTASASV